MTRLLWLAQDIVTFVVLPVLILGLLRLPWASLSALVRFLRR